MTGPNQSADKALDDILHELALAKRVPDPAILDDFVRRYPEHAEALTTFAIELALDSSLEKAADVNQAASSSETVSKAMSHFHNELYTVKAEASKQESGAPPTLPPNPFATLDRAGIRTLGERLHANSLFVIKLRDRHIREDTVTPGFRRLLANELDVPVELITAHLALPSAVPTHAHFKAEDKPAAPTKQTFEEAVRGSGLSPEDQLRLLTL